MIATSKFVSYKYVNHNLFDTQWFGQFLFYRNLRHVMQERKIQYNLLRQTRSLDITSL